MKGASINYPVGNKCGHNPLCPRLFERDTGQKKPPLAIQIASTNASYYYENSDDYLLNLQYARDSSRAIRTERREAVASVLRVLLNHCDMENLKVSQYHSKGESPISVKSIANKAMIGYRRCLRVIEDLKRARYLTMQYRHKHTSEGVVPLVAIKKLSAQLFYDLGVPRDIFFKCQSHVSKGLKKASKSAKKLGFRLGGLISNLSALSTKQTRVQAKCTVEESRIMHQRLYTLKIAHPDWTSTQLRAAL